MDHGQDGINGGICSEARATQGGQSVSKTSVNVLLSTVSTYAQFLNFMPPTPHLTESERKQCHAARQRACHANASEDHMTDWIISQFLMLMGFAEKWSEHFSPHQDGVMSDDDLASTTDLNIEIDAHGKCSSLQPSRSLSCTSCFFPPMQNVYGILLLVVLLYRTRYCV